jgi:hypothetical protein
MAESGARRCPYCGRAIRGWETGAHNEWAATRDHIFPKAWGGANTADNIRIVCNACNVLRGAAGHCLGALACVRAVAGAGYRSEIAILRAWALPRPRDPRGLRKNPVTWPPKVRGKRLRRIQGFRRAGRNHIIGDYLTPEQKFTLRDQLSAETVDQIAKVRAWRIAPKDTPSAPTEDGDA